MYFYTPHCCRVDSGRKFMAYKMIIKELLFLILSIFLFIIIIIITIAYSCVFNMIPSSFFSVCPLQVESLLQPMSPCPTTTICSWKVSERTSCSCLLHKTSRDNIKLDSWLSLLYDNVVLNSFLLCV